MNLEWEAHELTGQQVSGDWLVWDNGGVWYLDKLRGYEGYVTASDHETEEEAKDMAQLLEDME